MRLRLNWLFVAATLVLPAAMPTPSGAQAWLGDRDRAEGTGIRVGAFDLHPGIGLEGGYDSNVFLASDSPQEPAESSGIMRLSPHFYIATREVEDGPPPALKLRAGVSGTGKYYFTPSDLSIGIGQDLSLVVNPERPFSAELRQSYKLSQDPFTEPAGPAGGERDFNFDRHRLSVGPYLRLATPGGLLNGGLGYDYTKDFFTANEFSENDTQAHSILADINWEFLPKTAVFWNGTLRLRSYDNVRPDTPVERNDSTEPSGKVGLNGALTSTVGFTLAAGYGAAFYKADDDNENVIGQAELRWRPSTRVLVGLGYERQAVSAFQGNYANMDRVKAGTSVNLGGVFLLSLKGELTFVDYGRDDEILAAVEAVEATGVPVDLSGDRGAHRPARGRQPLWRVPLCRLARHDSRSRLPDEHHGLRIPSRRDDGRLRRSGALFRHHRPRRVPAY